MGHDFEEIFVQQIELARFIGLTTRRVHDLTKENIFKKTTKGYPFFECTQIYIEYLRARSDGKSQTTTTAEKLKERKLLAEAEMREIDLEEVKGRLIDVDKVRDVWIHMASNFKSKMISLPTKIASSCYGRAKPQIQREAQALINQALEELANSEPDE